MQNLANELITQALAVERWHDRRHNAAQVDYERIARKVIGLRAQLGLTQDDLATKASIAIGTLQGLEYNAKPLKSGKKNPRARATDVDKISTIARHLGTTLEMLEQDETVIQLGDARLRGLTEEQLYVARAFGQADTEVRQHIRGVLAGTIDVPRTYPTLEDAIDAAIDRDKGLRRTHTKSDRTNQNATGPSKRS